MLDMLMFVEEAPPQILVLNKSVTAALLLLYCCFTAALLLLYCWQILVLNKMDNYNEALQVFSLLALLVQKYKY
jgi:hypothetical protein